MLAVDVHLRKGTSNLWVKHIKCKPSRFFSGTSSQKPLLPFFSSTTKWIAKMHDMIMACLYLRVSEVYVGKLWFRVGPENHNVQGQLVRKTRNHMLDFTIWTILQCASVCRLLNFAIVLQIKLIMGSVVRHCEEERRPVVLTGHKMH